MGIGAEDVAKVVYGSHAWRDGQVMDEAAFFEAHPEDAFDAFTGIRVLPEDLLVREIEVPRDPRELLLPPITAADVVAADLQAIGEHLARLIELDAPSILLRHARSLVHGACEDLSGGTRWCPLDELMTGRPAAPGASGAPHPGFAVSFASESGETSPRDCAFLDTGFLVQFRYASVVLSADGEVRDVFATCALRAVGSDARHVALVCGGGFTSSSGYFGAEAFVRDVAEHRWTTGAIPGSLPRFLAGTIGDVKWSIVVDVVEGRGYRMAPRWMGDQCGSTFNSTCGRYAWDGSRFVLEASTGTAVLDTRDLRGALVSFARTANGWRFVMLDEPTDDEYEEHEAEPWKLRLLDERGACIRELEDFEHTSAWALSPDGERLLHVTADRLRVLDADGGDPRGPSIDLRPLGPAIALPDDVDLWRRLTAAYAVPAALAGATLDQAREAIEDMWGDAPSDEALAAAIDVARTRPTMPKALPRIA